jgi:hypothetical protein
VVKVVKVVNADRGKSGKVGGDMCRVEGGGGGRGGVRSRSLRGTYQQKLSRLGYVLLLSYLAKLC